METILKDLGIHYDKTIQANRQGIVVKNHNDKTSLPIDMYLPSDSNVSLKIFEKLSKYKDSEIELAKIWHLKKITLAVVIGALGMVVKTALNYVSRISGEPLLTELQKITFQGSAYQQISFFENF